MKIEESQKDEIINDMQNNLQNGNMKEKISEVKDGQDFIIEDNESSITITTSKNQKNNKNHNVTIIDLGECENKLKTHYNLSANETLYILKVESKKGSSIPKVEYEVYYPLNNDDNLYQLNLTICGDSKIDIFIPYNLKNENLEKHDKNSAYYNDICYTTTSEKGTDISLKDRKNLFVEKDMTLCEENCDLIGYDNFNQKAICSCEVKVKIPLMSEIYIDKQRLYNSFSNIKNIANLKLMKCYFVLFTLKGINKNYGVYIIILIIFLYFICIIVFYAKDYDEIKTIIKELINIKINFNNKIPNSTYNFRKEKHKKKEKISKYKKQIKETKEPEKNIKGYKKQKTKHNKDVKEKIDDEKNVEGNKKINRENDNNINENKNNERKINKDPIFEKIEEPLFIKFLRRMTKKNENDKKVKDIKHSPPIKKLRIDRKRKYKINSMKISSSDNNYSSMNNSSKKSINLFKNYSLDYPKKFQDIMKYTLYELNILNYQEASKVDKRTYFQYYNSLLKTKHLLIFSFYPMNDYNSKIIKIYLFFFAFIIYTTINASFFNEETLHIIYKDGGGFNLMYQIPQILYSSLISSVLNTLLRCLALSERNVLEVKHEKNITNMDKRAEQITKVLCYKFIIYFIISFILLLSFGYYLSCFCAIYKNTQIHLLKDSGISFGLSMIYPFALFLLPGILRIPALNAPKKNRETMYKISKIIQLI